VSAGAAFSAYASLTRLWATTLAIVTADNQRTGRRVWLRHQRYARDTVCMITTSRRRAMGQGLAKLAALMDG